MFGADVGLRAAGSDAVGLAADDGEHDSRAVAERGFELDRQSRVG